MAEGMSHMPRDCVFCQAAHVQYVLLEYGDHGGTAGAGTSAAGEGNPPNPAPEHKTVFVEPVLHLWHDQALNSNPNASANLPCVP